MSIIASIKTNTPPKIKLLYICKFSGKENAKYFQNFYLCKMLILCKLKNILKKKCKNICEKLKHFLSL